MKKRFSIILCLTLILALSIVLLTSCGSSIKAGEANIEVEKGKLVDDDFISDSLKITVKYYTDGGYILLKGDKADEMSIAKSYGVVKEVNLQQIENKIKVDNKNIKIVSVNDQAFMQNQYLETVDLSNKEKIDNFTIGMGAFGACPNLTTVKLPENIHSYGNVVGNNAFAYNVKLSTIDGMEKFNIVNESAFMNCISLKSITLSTQTKVINDYCFSNCDKLETVNNLNNVQSIGKESFSATMVKDIDFNAMSQLKTIGEGAFAGAKLTKVNLPDSIISYGKNAFINNPLVSVDVPFIGRFGGTDSIFNYFGYNKNLMIDGPDYTAPDFSLNIRKAISIESSMFEKDSFTNKLTAVSISLVPNGYYKDLYIRLFNENIREFGPEYEGLVGQIATEEMLQALANKLDAPIDIVKQMLTDYYINGVRLDKQDKIEIVPEMYNINPDIKSFKVNGEEKYVAPEVA